MIKRSTILFLLVWFAPLATKGNPLSKEDSTELKFKSAKALIRDRSIDLLLPLLEDFESQADNPTDYTKIFELYQLLGHVYEERADYQRSIDLYQKGYALGIKYGDVALSSRAFVEISQSYRIFHDYEKAIHYGRLAYQEALKDSANQPLMLSTTLGVIGSGMTEMGNLDSAVVYEEKALEYLSVLDSSLLRANIVNIGHTYMELGRLEESRIYTELGLALYLPDGDPYAIGSIYTNLAMYANRANKLRYALQMFDSALHYTEQSQYIETLVWIYKERAEVYQKLGQHDMAAKDLEMLLVVKDSTFNTNRDQIIQEQEARFQTAQKEKQIAIQNATIEAKNAQLYFNRWLISGLGLTVIVLLLISLLIRNRMALRQQKMLAHEKAMIKEAQISAGIQSQEKERQRFAKDLHDNMGQMISMMNISMNQLLDEKPLSKEDQVHNLTNCKSTLDDMYKEVKNVCFDLMPQSLQTGGLTLAIEEFSSRVNALGTVQIELVTFGDALTEANDLTTSIYRICQEWVNNILKYSDAKNVTVQLINDEQEFMLMIEDDGRGFSKNDLNYGSGYGWKNIISRANFVKGEVDLDTEVNRRGNTFTLVITK